jgi:hypothetical protein
MLDVCTLQLASVVLHFEKLCFDPFSLSPLNYFFLPTYSFHVSLANSKAKFECLKHDVMISFIEQGARDFQHKVCHVQQYQIRHTKG